MAKPQTRQQLKEYCLRQLGHSVIGIYVDDYQLEKRIDESIQLYNEYHFDGSEKLYLKHQVTASLHKIPIEEHPIICQSFLI